MIRAFLSRLAERRAAREQAGHNAANQIVHGDRRAAERYAEAYGDVVLLPDGWVPSALRDQFHDGASNR